MIPKKQNSVSILMYDKTDFQSKLIKRDMEVH